MQFRSCPSSASLRSIVVAVMARLDQDATCRFSMSHTAEAASPPRAFTEAASASPRSTASGTMWSRRDVWVRRSTGEGVEVFPIRYRGPLVNLIYRLHMFTLITSSISRQQNNHPLNTIFAWDARNARNASQCTVPFGQARVERLAPHALAQWVTPVANGATHCCRGGETDQTIASV